VVTRFRCIKSNMLFKGYVLIITIYESVFKVGDGRELEVKGIGEVELETITNGKSTKIKIADTLYVPDMRVNLISIGQLSKKGFIVLFEKNLCKIKFGRDLVAVSETWSQNSNLFELLVVNNKNLALTSSLEISKWKLWHYRLGHLGSNNMKIMRTEDEEFSKEKYDKGFCEGCALGKQTKQPHKLVEKVNKVTDHVIIHSDLMGPMRTK